MHRRGAEVPPECVSTLTVTEARVVCSGRILIFVGPCVRVLNMLE
ncbi:hypothetical protein A4W95_00756 [Treponema pallidum subsp. pallidum]|nr:hypothetical protein A4W95_00756 [Treponema pallidum subsp. pallidum]